MPAARKFAARFSGAFLLAEVRFGLLSRIGNGLTNFSAQGRGEGIDEDLKRSGLAGFSEHLVKPIDFSQLEQAMRRVVAEGRE